MAWSMSSKQQKTDMVELQTLGQQRELLLALDVHFLRIEGNLDAHICSGQTAD
jgi:hypothetical protein